MVNCWERPLTLLGRGDESDQVTCMEGEGHPCTEDVGGQDGWEVLKAAYRATEPDEEQRELMEWFEIHASNEESRGLAGDKVMAWDTERANAQLARLPEWPPTGNPERSTTTESSLPNSNLHIRSFPYLCYNRLRLRQGQLASIVIQLSS